MQLPLNAAAAGSEGIVARLRQRLRDGDLPAGTRLGEEAMAEWLGVSRTPVRLAFRTLAQEGLLQPAGKRGFVVRAFSDADVHCAVEVRGVLEGLAARRLAERGLDDAVRRALQQCLVEGDAVLATGRLTDDSTGAWSRLNQAFHGAIVHADGSRVVADAIARNDHLPFASADSIMLRTDALDREFEKLKAAQLQHRLIVDALERRESARVEMLMREHALIGVRYAGVLGL
jgi:GntR family transcriptional regulator, vanillate catabolism transcriptional regulator